MKAVENRLYDKNLCALYNVIAILIVVFTLTLLVGSLHDNRSVSTDDNHEVVSVSKKGLRS